MSERRHQVRSIVGLLGRDLTVMRRDLRMFLLRTVMNPLFFVFVFTYVFPRTGQGFAGGGVSFATVLLPGLVAVAMIFQGIAAVAIPMVNEFGRTREIEDRVLAPLPIAVIALEKILFGALQSLLAAAVVFPLVWLIPTAPVSVQVPSVTLLVVVMAASSLVAGSFGLVIGASFKPQQIPLIFSTILIPVTFLGCVYYPWARLQALPWLKYAVLLNPIVYISEGLRAALTPQLEHMPLGILLPALLLVVVGLGTAGVRAFTRRVVS